MSEDLVRLFWGKAGRDQVPIIHPALFHMIDVGMVAHVLVEEAPETALRGLLDSATEREVRARVVGFLVALHDLGKISPGFQALRKDLCEPLIAAGYKFSAISERDHSRVTLEHVRRLHSDNEPARRLAQVVAAHHGCFHNETDPDDEELGSGKWEVARNAAIAVLADLFEVDAEAALAPEALSPSGGMVLAGLTAVADWIGSDKKRFPPCGAVIPTLQDYARKAEQQAQEAVAELGWNAWSPDGHGPEFQTLFPGKKPNALQQLAEKVAAGLPGPGLVLIEAPMGTGKTEAALLIADRCLNRFGHVGLFCALPTQATSNQMFGRFAKYLRQRVQGGDVNLHLLHGLASYQDLYDALPGDFAEPEPSGVDGMGGQGQELPARLMAAFWFRGQKRGLLAPFGVGTVDQALLAVLQTRHMFVRLYGLANKVVILDEVHAYDTYTTGLMEELLRWLAAMRCTVVLLSATLPAEKRNSLIRAYAGADAPEPNRKKYPRIIVASPGQAPVARAIPRRKERGLRLEAWPRSPQALAEEVAARLRRGGCCAWFCNTVRSAQLTYLMLDAHPELRGRVRLIHAQFPVWQRRDLESDVESKFGEEGSRPGEVWVTTQVLEQSLDVDFDLMVTELAPIDLMLQRSGRLQRHKHQRPQGLEERTLLWLDPGNDAEGIPAFGDSRYVYSSHFLLHTWLALQECKRVEIPDDIEGLIERVYGEPGVPIPVALTEAAKALRQEWMNESGPAALQAKLTVIPPPDDDDPFQQTLSLLDDEDAPNAALPLRALTRLGEPTVTLVCACRVGERLVLDPETDARDPQRLPSHPSARREAEKALLLRSVRLQSKEWVPHFAAQPPPKAWEESSALRHCRLLPLTDGFYVEKPGRLLLHPKLGLVRHEDVLKKMPSDA
jgi:CRISPR-associated endonuclease/helicase Cas3